MGRFASTSRYGSLAHRRSQVGLCELEYIFRAYLAEQSPYDDDSWGLLRDWPLLRGVPQRVLRSTVLVTFSDVTLRLFGRSNPPAEAHVFLVPPYRP